MITINLHGKLGKDLGESWEFEVSSVAEAIRAIDVNSKKLRHWILDHIEKYEYIVLINGNNLLTESKEFKNVEELKNSEFYLDLSNKIERIDIVPKIIGHGFLGDLFNNPYVQVGVGAAATAGGIFLAIAAPPLAPLGIGLALAGIGLIANGVSQLLSKPPPNVPYTAQQVNPIDGLGEAGGPTSYLFNGPVNTVGEGGPVPIGYGELVIGGNNVFTNYDYLYRAYTSDYNSVSYQQVNEGSNQYLFNSACYLSNQQPLQSSPF
jgi:predicted phage tail protein